MLSHFILTLTLLLAFHAHLVAADVGCGISLPVSAVNAAPASNTAAQNASFFNAYCTNYQCSRAARDSAGYFCVRGFDKGDACLVSSDCYHALECDGNSSTCVKQKATSKQQIAGYVALATAMIGWGSNFVPARRLHSVGNGLKFNFILCNGVLLVGLLLQIFRALAADNNGFVFYPLASVGGFIWSLANSLAVPVINLLGMGLAVSLWGASNALFGYLSAFFGFWDLKITRANSLVMSWIGFVVLIGSMVCFAATRPTRHDNPTDAADGADHAEIEINKNTNNDTNNDTAMPILQRETAAGAVADAVDEQQEQAANTKKPNQFPIIDLVGGVGHARVLGVFAAVMIGMAFGVNCDPVVLLVERSSAKSASNNVKVSPYMLDYVASHFAGTWLAALLSYSLSLVYDAVQRGWPDGCVGRIPNLFGDEQPFEEMLFPGLAAGVLWAVAQSGNLYAQTQLSMEVAYALGCALPSVIAVLWSLFYFKELSGTYNAVILAVAFVLLGVGGFLIAHAKNA